MKAHSTDALAESTPASLFRSHHCCFEWIIASLKPDRRNSLWDCDITRIRHSLQGKRYWAAPSDWWWWCVLFMTVVVWLAIQCDISKSRKWLRRLSNLTLITIFYDLWLWPLPPERPAGSDPEAPSARRPLHWVNSLNAIVTLTNRPSYSRALQRRSATQRRKAGIAKAEQRLWALYFSWFLVSRLHISLNMFFPSLTLKGRGKWMDLCLSLQQSVPLGIRQMAMNGLIFIYNNSLSLPKSQTFSTSC